MASKFMFRLLPVLLLPFLSGCSDQRATAEIQGSAHALSLIRITGMPWSKTAEYAIVAARMPDCMRRHSMPEAAPDARVEVFAPGNNAWILRQAGKMYVVETRTCEGFAKLDAVPAQGLGTPLGVFEMKDDVLVFTKAPPPAVVPAAVPATN